MENDVRRANDAIGFGKTTGTLPHAHHIVGNIAPANEQVLIGTKCRFGAAIQIIAQDQTVIHGYGHNWQALPSGLLPIREKITQV
ncbi:hypothetical protein CRBSH125_33310 [Afipia carboxidovorans]|nr:hypothetical protein CRBSH125_33310 [Afipia carboxidovorans]